MLDVSGDEEIPCILRSVEQEQLFSCTVNKVFIRVTNPVCSLSQPASEELEGSAVFAGSFLSLPPNGL